jgi:hypothetical protein
MNTTSIALAFSALALCQLGNALAQPNEKSRIEWHEIVASTTSKAYLNRQSIQVQGKYLKAWTMWLYPQGVTVQDLHYKSLKSLIYYDCRNTTYAIRQTHYFASENASGKQIDSNFFKDSELGFTDPVPGSTGYTMLKAVCASFKR